MNELANKEKECCWNEFHVMNMNGDWIPFE